MTITLVFILITLTNGIQFAESVSNYAEGLENVSQQRTEQINQAASGYQAK